MYHLFGDIYNFCLAHESNSFLFTIELIVRIVLASTISIVIGIERRNRFKSAGIRTHLMVGLASALIMIVSKYGFNDIDEADKSRVAAQVVSGIGFLGAGMIFLKNSIVKNLTTAAGIWATSGIGLAIGSGLYVVGISAAAIMFVMQYILHKLDFFKDIPSEGAVVILLKENDEIKDIEFFCKSRNIEIEETKISRVKDGLRAEFHLVFMSEQDKKIAVHEFTQLENVLEIRHS